MPCRVAHTQGPVARQTPSNPTTVCVCVIPARVGTTEFIHCTMRSRQFMLININRFACHAYAQRASERHREAVGGSRRA